MENFNEGTFEEEKKPKADIRTVLICVLLAMSIFPYFSPVHLGIDTSPFYLVAATLLLFLGIAQRTLSLPPMLWGSCACWTLLAVLSFLKWALDGNSNSLRISIGLASQALLILGCGAAFSGPGAAQRLHVALRFFGTAMFFGSWLWLGAALLQLFSRVTGSSIGTDITDHLVTASRTTEGRGLTSLATEPSYAGLTGCALAASCWIWMLNAGLSPFRARIAIAFYSIVTLLTISLVSYLAFAILGLFIARRVTAWAFFAILLIGASAFVPWDAIQDVRIVQLINTIVETPSLILADVSTATRAADILSRFLTLGGDHGVWGHLLSTDMYELQRTAIQSIGGNAGPYLLRGLDESGPDAKGMSSLGQLSIDFGIFGLLVYGLNVLAFRRTTARQGIKGVWIVLLLATFGYLVQLPFSYPTITTTLVLLSFLAIYGRRIRAATIYDDGATPIKPATMCY